MSWLANLPRIFLAGASTTGVVAIGSNVTIISGAAIAVPAIAVAAATVAISICYVKCSAKENT